MKAIIIDGKIKVYGELPNEWKNHTNFRQASIELQQHEGFYDVAIPVIDSKFQKLGSLYWDEANKVFTYAIIDKSTEEIAADKESMLHAIDNDTIEPIVLKRLLQSLSTTILTKTTVTIQDVDDLSLLYPQYRVGVNYLKLQRFNHEGKFYEAINDFFSTDILDPKNVVDMYVKYVK